MIELRWIVGARNDTERVLQYRQRVWVPCVIEGLSLYGPWSDWTEVPTVSEDNQ